MYHETPTATERSLLSAEHTASTHSGQVKHICVSKVTIIVSDNGLSPGRRQAIIWNNGGIMLIVPLGTNFTGILIAIHTFSFKKMHLKMSSGKWQPFCLGLNVLTSKHFQWLYIQHRAFRKTFNFLKHPQNRHPTTLLLRQYMGCLLWV